MDYPRAGAHYPRSTGEFLAWFGTDEDCLDYLEWLRWPGGFACPHCGHAGGWRLADGRIECGGCSRRTSVTAGTIFDKTRTPLTVWFHACWLFATAKDGISAQYLQRSLEIGSYQTAWSMLHRLRSALVRPGRGLLAGTVEVDETFIGGEEHGLRGGRQPGKKVLTGVAVEISEPKGIGRCRMAVLADASAATLRPFVTGNVEPGSRVITDGWVGYNGLAARGYDHERRNQKAAARRGEDPGELLPAVHRVSSLCKRWLLGTHQGRVEPAHLQAYLNEFAFRFNRRHSRSRGMVFYRVLELAARHDPVRYNDIRATKKPRGKPPQQRGTGHPPSLDRPTAARPWRTAEMQLQFPLRLSGYPGAFFDSVSWDLALKAVACHTDQKWVLLYVERWLKAPMLMPDGTLTERTQGTPQGGPISPLLANLFLHYGFDRWLSLEYPGCRFERFADDAVIHCVTERQALEVRDAVGRRFASIGLTLHPDKTKIVFCKDGKRRRDFPVTSFTFCGYEFRPRRAFNKATREAFTNFLPAAAPGKITEIGRKVASWKLHRHTDLTLDAIAKQVNPVVGGWLAYFTAFYSTAVKPLCRRIDRILVRWAMNKYKRLKGSVKRAREWLRMVRKRAPRLFAHWELPY